MTELLSNRREICLRRGQPSVQELREQPSIQETIKQPNNEQTPNNKKAELKSRVNSS
ncbi:2596_t:CDS:2 [Funneliformis geosporum]|uniref:2596_t:CDS:1 n=1 Tax=Funneliformis geosporum TaxID=1117311 RepID=A0A9W4SBH2_9GLOM|nr:2596_t:CDS:2 [Funneliformis geosporum]